MPSLSSSTNSLESDVGGVTEGGEQYVGFVFFKPAGEIEINVLSNLN